MKKTHEYETPVLSKLVSVVTVLAICVCALCSAITCYKMTTLTVAAPAASSNSGNGGNSGNSGNNGSSGGGSSVGGNGGNTDASNEGGNEGSNEGGNEGGGQETDKAAILAKYTEVMDNLKSNVKTYDKKEYQTLSDDRDLGTLGNAVIGIANGLMTSEDKAELQHREDYQQIPVCHNTKGCILTDVNAIKSATMKDEGGKTTIVIVLVDEESPLPAEENATSCKSAIGSMFNPIDQKGIDDIVSKFSGIANIQKFTLTGWDCTATLVFDTASGHVESLHQTMNYRIDVDAKVAIMSLKGYANLINNMHIDNVVYK